jgi:hypothetical protein
MPDFEDVAATLKNHFCPECGRSFECDEDDGYCCCPGTKYSIKPWCDECAEIQKAQDEAEADKDESEEFEDDDDDDY